jgi:hypothetical protein
MVRAGETARHALHESGVIPFLTHVDNCRMMKTAVVLVVHGGWRVKSRHELVRLVRRRMHRERAVGLLQHLHLRVVAEDTFVNFHLGRKGRWVHLRVEGGKYHVRQLRIWVCKPLLGRGRRIRRRNWVGWVLLHEKKVVINTVSRKNPLESLLIETHVEV